jgi:tRNA-dihydrouridine synthase A
MSRGSGQSKDPEVVLPSFFGAHRQAGVTQVMIHARKAWLRAKPQRKRDVPPLVTIW